jgi:hypothetical protein
MIDPTKEVLKIFEMFADTSDDNETTSADNEQEKED